MDERYLLAAVRYVELNPVRVGLVGEPWSYPWSSAHAQLTGVDDHLIKAAPLLVIVTDWRGFLLSPLSEKDIEALRKHERTGRPLGNERFVEKLEVTLGRILRRQKPDRKTGGDEQN
jgi:putative transposase